MPSIEKQKKNKRHFKRISIIHALITFCFFAFYIGMGLLLNPDFLFSDMQHKYRLAAFTVSATVRVWGPPATPTVSATPGCTSESSYMLVDWADDENATSFDVFRNGAELITGLVTSSYQDNNVTDLTDYDYYLVARGPEGDATSATESTTTTDCSSPSQDPEIAVARFESYDMTSYSSVPRTTDHKPEFYGTSNFAYGLVRAELLGDPVIVSTTVANVNGYWSWTPAANIPHGLHTIYFTLIDPGDPSRTDTKAFTFRIKKKPEQDDDDDEGGISETVRPLEDTKHILDAGIVPQQLVGQKEIPGLQEQAPIELALQISEINAVTVQGTELSTQVYPGYTMTFEVTVAALKGIEPGQPPVFVYSILDADEEEIYRDSEERKVSEGELFSKKITLPRELEPGKYKLRIEAIAGGYSVSEERYFYVQDNPIIALKSNMVGFISSFISDLGWIVMVLLLILLILIIFAIVEWRIHHRDDSGMPRRLKKKRAH